VASDVYQWTGARCVSDFISAVKTMNRPRFSRPVPA
jgi:hypothetical protein